MLKMYSIVVGVYFLILFSKCEWMVEKSGNDLPTLDPYFQHPGETFRFLKIVKYPWTNYTYHYGGYVYQGGWHYKDDLWSYNMFNNTWTLITGDPRVSNWNPPTLYGSKFTYGSGNQLGGRYDGGGWMSYNSSKLFIFGGKSSGFHSDLWTYSFTLNEWAWIGGISSIGEEGGYPTKGTCGDQASSYPGAKINYLNWIDPNDVNKLYLYGGMETTAVGDDLWYFDLSMNKFCYIYGQHTPGMLQGTIYPVHHIHGYDVLNIPGARRNSITWTYVKSSSESELCFFSGSTQYWSPIAPSMSDMFCYSTLMNMWAWKGGPSSFDQHGKYSEYWSHYDNSHPGSRIDSQGQFLHNEYLFIFGGRGLAIENCYNHLHKSSSNEGYSCIGTLCDLWVYHYTTFEWKYISGLSNKGRNTYISINARDVASWNYNDTESYTNTNYPESKFGFVMDNNGTRLMLFGGSTNTRTFYTSTNHWSHYVWTFKIPSIVYERQIIHYCNSIPSNDSNVCSGNGRCKKDGNCECIGGYSGNNCENLLCYSQSNISLQCSYPKGECIRSDTCKCKSYDVTGFQCEIPLSFNRSIQCISRCDVSLSHDSLMTFSFEGLQSCDGLNFIGARIKSSTFAYNGYIYIFGGGNGGCDDIECGLGYFNDFWTYDVENICYQAHIDIGADPREGKDNIGAYPVIIPSNYEKNIYPSARRSSFTLQDPSKTDGIFFLYGGDGPNNFRADLWSFSSFSMQWKLWNGTDSNDVRPIRHIEHGRPGGRVDYSIWLIDSIIYLFGGTGFNSGGFVENWLNDMWIFDTSKIENELKWEILEDPSDAESPYNLMGNYDTQCMNVYNCSFGLIYPCRRNAAQYWHINTNDGYELWMYGGNIQSNIIINDLLSYSIILGSWKWISGLLNGYGEHVKYLSHLQNPIDYHINNAPSARRHAATNVIFDLNSNEYFLFMFGGDGYDFDAFSHYTLNNYYLNDMWIYSYTKDQWKFIGGSARKFFPGRFYGAAANESDVQLDYPGCSARNKLILDEKNGRVYYMSGIRGWRDYTSDIWELHLSEFNIKVIIDHDVIDNWVVIIIIICIFIFFVSLLCVLLCILLYIAIRIMLFKEVQKKNDISIGKSIGESYNETELDDEEMNKLVKKFKNSDMLRIEMSKINLIKQIGQGGSSSTIYVADWNGQSVALKLFKAISFGGMDMNTDEFEREFKIISSVNHPNVIQFFGYTVSTRNKSSFGIVMEHCEKGDLKYFIGKSVRLKETIEFRTKKKILFETASGMEYLHDRNIIHRDLKSSNVLLTDTHQAKLIDFGLSRIIKDMSNMNKTRRIGTSYYMAPEIVSTTKYDEKVDVFSFGIVAFELLEETTSPYGQKARDYSAIELKVANNPNFRPMFKKESMHEKKIVEMVKLCWNHDPQKRPSFKDLKVIFK